MREFVGEDSPKFFGLIVGAESFGNDDDSPANSRSKGDLLIGRDHQFDGTGDGVLLLDLPEDAEGVFGGRAAGRDQFLNFPLRPEPTEGKEEDSNSPEGEESEWKILEQCKEARQREEAPRRSKVGRWDCVGSGDCGGCCLRGMGLAERFGDACSETVKFRGIDQIGGREFHCASASEVGLYGEGYYKSGDEKSGDREQEEADRDSSPQEDAPGGVAFQEDCVDKPRQRENDRDAKQCIDDRGEIGPILPEVSESIRQ